MDGVLDHDRVRAVARQLAVSGRRGSVPVLSAFLRLVRLDRNQHAAIVQSAVPLGDEMRQRVQVDLARVYGPGIDTSFEENPLLIGGIRIRIGSDVYDDSVRARLSALSARL
jgi:F-type H+-transporting ATPase subunit delta